MNMRLQVLVYCLFRTLFRQRMPLHRGQLRQREDNQQRHVAPDLDGNPEVGGDIAPDDFVDHRHQQEEQAPAERKNVPALGAETDGEKVFRAVRECGVGLWRSAENGKLLRDEAVKTGVLVVDTKCSSGQRRD